MTQDKPVVPRQGESIRDPGAVSRPVTWRGVLLLSGGIDSPVAGHLLARQGMEIVGLHCSLEPFTDAAPEEKTRRIAHRLGFAPLLVARLGDALAELARTCEHRYYFVLSKRFMLRVGGRVAAREDADFLITGESLGQVSSQTLANLAAIDGAVTLPILRPLVGWDKVDIVDRAKAIGTYEISVGPEVCDVLGPAHPVTQARPEIVEREEARLDLDRLLAEALETVEEVPTRPVAPPEAK